MRKVVNISDEQANHRQEVTDILDEFEPMEGGYLGRIDTVKHHIDLQPESRPIYRDQYCAGLLQRKFENTERENML